MAEEAAALDVLQESDAEAGAPVRALDQAGDVGHDEGLGRIVSRDDAQVRNERRERVVGDLRLRRGDHGDQGGLARVGETRRSPRRPGASARSRGGALPRAGPASRSAGPAGWASRSVDCPTRRFLPRPDARARPPGAGPRRAPRCPRRSRPSPGGGRPWRLRPRRRAGWSPARAFLVRRGRRSGDGDGRACSATDRRPPRRIRRCRRRPRRVRRAERTSRDGRPRSRCRRLPPRRGSPRCR